MTVSITQNKAAPTATEDSPLAAGTVIGGKYELVHPLGRGAFAWVYLAKHRDIPSLKLAVKVLRDHVAFDEQVRDRFRAEAVLAAQLQSPNVVRVTDYGSPEGKAPFIVMEYVQGETLSQRIERNGPVPEPDVARIGIHIAGALKEAHSHGIVHRDLKPSNIYLVESPTGGDFTAKVLDFGIAKVLTGLSAAEMVAFETASLSINCTPRYASPELLRGQPSAQSDVYALGITMLEAVNGMPPYTSQNTFETAAQHLADSPVPLGNADGLALAPVLRRACAKDPDERYLSAAQMLTDLVERFDPNPTGRVPLATDEFATVRNRTTDEEGFPRIRTNVRPVHEGTDSEPVPAPATPPSGFETTGYVPDVTSEVSDNSHLTTLMPRFDEGSGKTPTRTLLLVAGALILAAVAALMLIDPRGVAESDPAPDAATTMTAPHAAEETAGSGNGLEDQVAAVAVPEEPTLDPGPAAGEAASAIEAALASAERARRAELEDREERETRGREAGGERSEDDRRDRDSERDRDDGDEREDEEDPSLAEPVPVPEPEPEPEPESPPVIEEAAPEPEEGENPFGGLNTIGR